MGPWPSLAQSQPICPVACCLLSCASAPMPESGKEHPGRREGSQPSREPVLAGSLRSPVPLHESQPGGFTDQVTEAWSGPRLHSAAGPEPAFLIPGPGCSPFPAAPLFPLEHLGSRSGGRTEVRGVQSPCLSPLHLSPPIGQKADGEATAASWHPQGCIFYHPLSWP